MTRRELLATRVLSVDAYWQELRDPRGRPSREIPVPLWPGESLAQYEREFGRWLAARRLSLAAMRDDPVAERNCRVQFAQTRVAKPNDADVVQVDSADTDDAASEPDTTPADSAQHEMSDSNPADDSDEHDGDVMNPDGCCCTKCMRNWAKTLTERMDQLEENVMGLKREVNQAPTTTVGSS
ncbi:uncharacterized protein IUM83_01360 [Phytophthora cinnamomi]|uniref:uncharacterized protein n=1 Tax=Phytophthora cinnamomi TaxID=4785 RepID=UPI00355A90B6|nr:hypothetical protein IUM83_01360 [Phytophthora cinnamomi]